MRPPGAHLWAKRFESALHAETQPGIVTVSQPVRGMVFLCSVPLVPAVTVGLDFGNMVTPEVTSAPRFRDDLGRDLFDNQTARRVFFHDCADDVAEQLFEVVARLAWLREARRVRKLRRPHIRG